MRHLISLLFLVIFSFVQMTSAEAAHLKCCPEFSRMKIPMKLVASYSWSSSNCPTRAIVFKTVSGREICVDPEATWVSGYIDKVDKRTTV